MEKLRGNSMKYIWNLIKENKIIAIAAIVIVILAYNALVG
jgi:hypothetical protein